jgi:hypothetical protein
VEFVGGSLIGYVLANRTSYYEHAKEYRQIEGVLDALEMLAFHFHIELKPAFRVSKPNSNIP